MRKQDRLDRSRRRRYRELIHLLNQRYYREHQRAERLQADLALLQSLRATWFFRGLQRVQRWIRLQLRTQRPRSTVNDALIVAPIVPTGKVSIIIPFRDQLELLRDCLRSLRASTYRDYEVILVDNGSADVRMHRYLCKALLHKRYHVVHAPGEYNFSHLCNRGAEQAKGDYVLFLNNDTSVITPDWLEQLLIVAGQPQVGIVGATLLYPDGSIQHAGMFQDREGRWDHLQRGEQWSTFQSAGDVRSVSAVTGACLLTSRDLFFEMEGFDESLPLIHNDTDLCQRVRQFGFLTAVTPHAQLFHYESLSRGFGDERPN